METDPVPEGGHSKADSGNVSNPDVKMETDPAPEEGPGKADAVNETNMVETVDMADSVEMNGEEDIAEGINNLSVSDENKDFIKDMFNSMASLNATCPLHDPESDECIRKWVNGRELSSYIGGKFCSSPRSKITLVTNICTKKELAMVHLATQAELRDVTDLASEIYPTWSGDAFRRSNCLWEIALALEKQKHLFTMMESVCTGKSYPFVLNEEVPYLVQAFKASARNINIGKSAGKSYKAHELVRIRACAKNYPCLLHSWRIAPALGAGSIVVLEVDSTCTLSALLLAEIINGCRVPKGVFSVLPIDRFKSGKNMEMYSHCNDGWFAADDGFILDNFFSWALPQLHVELLTPKPSVAIVFEGCDINSAVAAIFKMYCTSFIQLYEGKCIVLVQDCMAETFVKKMKKKFESFVPERCLLASGFRNPFLEDVPGKERVFETAADGPMPISSFRTRKEAVSIFNQEMRGFTASVWGENMTLMLEVTKRMRACNIWLNIVNMYDMNVGYSSIFETGSFVSGGGMGFFSFNKPRLTPKRFHLNTAEKPAKAPLVMQFDLLIGGRMQTQPVFMCVPLNNSRDQEIARIPVMHPRDIVNSVESAVRAFSRWGKKTCYERIAVIAQIVKEMEIDHKKYCEMIMKSTGRTDDECMDELEACIARIKQWTCHWEYQPGLIKETEHYGRVLEIYEPYGTILIVCPDEHPLLSFISLLIPAIIAGNTVIAIPSQAYPCPVLYMALMLSKIRPLAGVINIILDHKSIDPVCEHDGVDMVWLTRSGRSRSTPFCSNKRSYIFEDRDWLDIQQGQSIDIVQRSLYQKNIWLPMGSIFS